LATPVHRKPQLPQLSGSDVSLTQVLPQRVVPDGQVLTHPPVTHAAFVPVHFWPHALQLFLSVCSSTQAVPPSPPGHELKPLLHDTVHVPPAHVAWALAMLVEQGRPQAPQFPMSVCVLVQAPPSHVTSDAGHADAHP
jgi:hypothetical protein